MDTSKRFLMMLRLLLRSFIFLLIGICIAACEAEATPVAAVVPDTPTPAFATATAAPPLRYALAANANAFIPANERSSIAEVALIDQLSDDGDTLTISDGYDVIAAYGLNPEWDASPITQQIALIINPDMPPLDEEAILTAIRQSQDAQAITNELGIPGVIPITGNAPEVNIRTQLANAGYPDGIVLSGVQQNIPGAELWIAQLAENNIELETDVATQSEAVEWLLNDDKHLALITITSDDQRNDLEDAVGVENIITLYEISISYIAAPGIDVTFTASGWPIPARSTIPTPSPADT